MFPYRFWCEHRVFVFVGEMPRNSVAGLHGSGVLSSLRNCVPVLYPHQQRARDPVSAHPPSIGELTVFHVSHSDRGVVTSHCDSNLHS